jgi:SOS response regulatory protein OraA/RecX
MNQDAKEAALRLLDYSDRTEKELRGRLLKKKYIEKDIDEVIEFLKEYGFVDDERYAKLYIAGGMRNGKGSVRLKNKLIEKGIPGEIIKQHIAEDIDPDTELHNCIRQALKILGLQDMFEPDPENNICRTDSSDYHYGLQGSFSTDADGALPEISEKDFARLARRLATAGYPAKYIYASIRKISNLYH